MRKSRFFHAFTFLSFVSGAALVPLHMAKADNLVDKMLACAKIETDAERLACYDRHVTPIKSAKAEGELHIVDSTEIKEIEKQSFGFGAIKLPWADAAKKRAEKTAKRGEKDSSRELSTRIVSHKKTPLGRYVFTLANGQVWVQTDNVKVRLNRKGENIAHIKKGALTSYRMQINDTGRSFYVKRRE